MTAPRKRTLLVRARHLRSRCGHEMASHLVDHVIPRAKGGEGDPDNGQVLCRDCNLKKSDKAP
ncbi:HNH endonuclease [Archangium lipolyticum]|uniref:HNH endonuclease n=1 Tax=Archangium lipolyticum TaxID=2970465 RepID=UPI0038991AFC